MQLRMGNRAGAHAQAGFTYLEILVIASMGIVALGAVGSFNRFQLHSLRHQALQNDLQMSARDVIDLFTREVRKAGANPTCAAGLNAIADAKQHLLRIQSDLDGDGTATGPGEDITYEYIFSSNRFDRTADGSTDSVIDGARLGGSRIRYFNALGAEVTAGSTGLSPSQRAGVRRVRLELVVRNVAGELADGSGVSVAVANDIELRNRYFVNPVSCP